MSYTFQRGETILLALDCVSGDVGDVSEITGTLRQATANGASAEFEITPRAASGDDPAGWTLMVPAAVTEELPVGTYKGDAKLTIAGITVITEPATVRITASASFP